MEHNTEAIRERLKRAVEEAERDEAFRAQLKADPKRALAKFDLQVKSGGLVVQDDGDPGCADFTCFTSMCPETCYVTVCSPSVVAVDPADRIDPARGAGLSRGRSEEEGGS